MNSQISDFQIPQLHSRVFLNRTVPPTTERTAAARSEAVTIGTGLNPKLLRNGNRSKVCSWRDSRHRNSAATAPHSRPSSEYLLRGSLPAPNPTLLQLLSQRPSDAEATFTQPGASPLLLPGAPGPSPGLSARDPAQSSSRPLPGLGLCQGSRALPASILRPFPLLSHPEIALAPPQCRRREAGPGEKERGRLAAAGAAVGPALTLCT